MTTDVDAETDRLFALPTGEFTGARNDLVRRLRAEKRSGEAKEVAALRRPTLPAWAVNQLARRDADGIRALIDAGGQLAREQRRLLSGVRGTGMRDAADRRRRLIAELTDRAAAILSEAGAAADAHRPAISATLEAASVGGSGAAAVQVGRLSAELPAPSSFGELGGLAVVPDGSDAAEEPDAGDRAVAAARVEQARVLLAQARTDAARAEDALAQARREEIAARDEADRLARRAAAAQEKSEAASRRVADAEDHARAAAAAVSELAADLEDALGDLP